MKRGHVGLSLIELLVVIAMISILGAIAIPSTNRSVLNLPTSAFEFEANMRLARGNATGRGVHYRVVISSNSYDIERLQFNPTVQTWEPDPRFAKETVSLPKNISIGLGAGERVEFNSRGLLEPNPDGTPATLVTVELHDESNGQTRAVRIWPSGQVQEV
jgi:prepilin-type N-terminal cleavage/methylation domain-containing protein